MIAVVLAVKALDVILRLLGVTGAILSIVAMLIIALRMTKLLRETLRASKKKHSKMSS